MDPARWERIQEIFHQVSDLPAAEQQKSLRAACGDDLALLADLNAMLDGDAQTRSILDSGLPPVAQTLLDHSRPLFADNEFGPYRIIKPLGEGGMGVVYLARREDIGSLVASSCCATDCSLRIGGNVSPASKRRWLGSSIR